MIKNRLIKLERLAEPFLPKKARRTWIIAAEGKDEGEAAAKIEKRIENIKAGKENHPIDKKPYAENDFFMTCHVIDLGSESGEKFDLEAMSYEMLAGERPGGPGDNGGPPGPTEEPQDKCLEVDNKAADELKLLKDKKAILEKLLKDENNDDRA